ncbi:hypothetical protein N8083_01890 [Candidatus Pacebacteria bacterium]|nr:hypothetical protein [Candidatus Paceibacterota bacterium]
MNKTTIIISIVALIIIGIGGRLLPHLPNATPIAALAFVGSMYFGRKAALLLPFAALFLSDFFIGFYSLGIMVSVYTSFLLIVVVSWFLKKHSSILAVGYAIMGASICFFLITNAAVWWFSPWYAKTLSGLLYSYELGLPFLRNMLIGDLVYAAILLTALAKLPHLIILCRKVFFRKNTVQTNLIA